MKHTKHGFKKYIANSLPLPHTKDYPFNKVLNKNDKIFYLVDNQSRKIYGKIRFIEGTSMVYAHWQTDNSEYYNSWGWMPIERVYVERNREDICIKDIKISEDLYKN